MFVLGSGSLSCCAAVTSPSLSVPSRLQGRLGMAAILSLSFWVMNLVTKWVTYKKTKLAAIEAEWETQPAPAAFTLLVFLSQECAGENHLRHSNSLRAPGHHRNRSVE
ncbi:hypothetical protein ACNKHQ_03315 [Shigella flexneri]